MRALRLTAPQVNDALTRFNLDAPGGLARVGGREQTVRVLGEAGTVEALRSLTIPTATGRYVRLSEVASIGEGTAEERSFARLNGRPVVAFQVNKTKESSDVDVEDVVDGALTQLEGERSDVRTTKLVSTVAETRASYSATVHVLLEGMALAALVVFIFLRDWRATSIAAVAMPLSLIPTFTFMLWLGFSLNIVTLLALTLVIGILVDDAIVEVENIEKRIERGETPYQAAVIGADQIGLAVVATTMSIVVVFVPVSFMGGMAGQYFREFGLTVAVGGAAVTDRRPPRDAVDGCLFPEEQARHQAAEGFRRTVPEDARLGAQPSLAFGGPSAECSSSAPCSSLRFSRRPSCRRRTRAISICASKDRPDRRRRIWRRWRSWRRACCAPSPTSRMCSPRSAPPQASGRSLPAARASPTAPSRSFSRKIAPSRPASSSSAYAPC
jgi:preprotein translocase subunit SecF